MQEIVSTIGGALVAFITSLVEALRIGFTEMFWEGTGEAKYKIVQFFEFLPVNDL